MTDTPAASDNKNKLARIDKLKNVLNAESVQAQFKNALGENKNAFVASIIDLYSGDEYLQNCDPNLVIMQALKAAVLKLAINKAIGHAYVIAYKNSNGVMIPQFQIGYKGLIQLALRTGWYKTINADVVYEGEYKVRNKLTGEFDLSGVATSERVIGYFAYIESINGFSKTYYMSKEKVLEHAKKYSKSFSQPYGPWTKETDAMGKKTVLNYLLGHYGLVSVEMQQGFDNDTDDQIQAEIKEMGNKGTSKGFDEAVVVQPTDNNNGGQQASSMGFDQNNTGNNNIDEGRPF